MVVELRHIRYFLAVARERNFSRAAVRLGIAQPPLSLQIKDLEREVGALLLRRSVHGAELTSAGQAFLDVVEIMPDLVERGVRAAQSALRGELGSLRVGFAASSAFSNVVPSVIRNFRKLYPDVAVILEESNTIPLLAGLHEGRIDVAFLRPGDAAGSEFQSRTILEEPLLLALPSSHRAAGDAEIDIAALKDEDFILFSRDVGPHLYDAIMATFQRAGVQARVDQFTLQFSSIIVFVAAELGLSIVPASMSTLNIKGLEFRSIKDQAPTTHLALACRRGNTSAVVRNFLAMPLDVGSVSTEGRSET